MHEEDDKDILARGQIKCDVGHPQLGSFSSCFAYSDFEDQLWESFTLSSYVFSLVQIAFPSQAIISSKRRLKTGNY